MNVAIRLICEYKVAMNSPAETDFIFHQVIIVSF